MKRFCALATVALLAACAAPKPTAALCGTLKVLSWNIWHGGHEDGDAGVERVIDIVRESGADVVLLVETYGSGARIAKALGFELLMHDPKDNLSILSRYPVFEDVSVWKNFHCIGAKISVPQLGPIAVYDVWLSYAEEIWEAGTREHFTAAQMVEQSERSSAPEMRAIVGLIESRLATTPQIPLLLGGDFNTMSHLDYTTAAQAQYGAVIDWPVSRYLESRGFTDSYRVLHPDVVRERDRTWSPRFPDQEADRIDFVHVRGSTLRPLRARVIDSHRELFPSDHAALLIEFEFDAVP